MTKILVRARRLYGVHDLETADLTISQVTRSYDAVESFLRQNAKTLVPRDLNIAPYLDDGIITGPKAHSLYSHNKCVIVNHYIHGNGFNFSGVYHTLITAGLDEKDIKNNFDFLEQISGHPQKWEDNHNFRKDIESEEAIKSLDDYIMSKLDIFSVEELKTSTK